MTEPYLEILNGGQTLRVNTTCPFLDMMDDSKIVYLPNAVDIPAGNVKDGMATIPLDPEYKNVLNVSFPSERDNVQTCYSVIAPPSIGFDRQGGMVNTLNDCGSPNGRTDEVEPGVGTDIRLTYPVLWSKINKYREELFSKFVPGTASAYGCNVVIIPYYLIGGKEYKVNFTGNIQVSTSSTRGVAYVFNLNGDLITKINKSATSGSATFIPERNGIYAIGFVVSGKGDNILDNFYVQIYWSGLFNVQTSVHTSPWGQVQYVKGMGRIDEVSGTGNFNLEINSNQYDNYQSKIGALWLYPSRFDRFEQYEGD